MAAQIVCKWFKFGFCKHKEYCRNQHVDEICDDEYCEIFRCRKRHPKMCRYFWNHGRCKFNPCAFLHKENGLTLEHQKIGLKIDAINNTLQDLEIKAKESEAIIQKLTIIERRFDTLNEMQRNISEKNKVIEDLTIRIIKLEERIETKEILSENILPEKIPETPKTSESEIDITEAEVIIKCTECDFGTTSQHGIKVHKAKQHASAMPCKICDFKAQTQNMLQIHIVTCELYKCCKCDYKSRRLSQVKAHIPKHHGPGDYFLTHLKMSRDDPSEVCEAVHYLKDL